MIQQQDHNELREALKDSIDALARDLLGKPSSRNAQELRFGKKGSISVVTRGRKCGNWFDHSAAEGGGPIKLVMREQGLDYRSAMHWARRWLGWPDDPLSNVSITVDSSDVDRRAAEIAARKAHDDRIEDEETAAKYERAQKLWNTSKPIEIGDRADLYLTNTRGIPRPATGWPSTAIRSNFGGLIAAAVKEDIETGGQCISLDLDGKKLPDQSGIAKRSFGALKGAAVRLPGNAVGPILIAEGLETGLSLWRATGYETVVTLGVMRIEQLAHLTMGRTIILCRDDDEHASTAFNAVRRVQRGLLRRGFKVRIAAPWAQQRQDKSDFNDVMKMLGPEGVRDRVLRASEDLPVDLTFLSIEAARAKLKASVSNFFERVAIPPETGSWFGGGIGEHDHIPDFPSTADVDLTVGISATMALGKTEAVLTEIIEKIADMRSQGDTRAILFAVPYHRLSDDLLTRALPKGLRVRVWRGQASHDFDGEPMCNNLEEAQENASLLIPPEVTCGECPRRAGCRYIAQYEQPAADEGEDDLSAPPVDLWIVAHQLLFSAELPKPIRSQGIAARIVDESIHQAAVVEKTIFALEGMLKFKLPDYPCDANDLDTARKKLCNAIRKPADDTPLHRGHLEVEGLTYDEVLAAHALEWKRKLRCVGSAPLRKEDLLPNKTLLGMSALWSAAIALLSPARDPNDDRASGWLEATTTADGCKAIIVRSRKYAASDCPTLLINGTFVTELERLVFPSLQMAGDINVDIPHQYIIQATDRTFNNDFLKSPDVRKALHVIAVVTGLCTGRDVLVVCNKGTADAMRSTLPTFVEVANYGAFAGRDEWRGRGLILAGRNQVPARAAEDDIMSLTGWAVERVPDGKYPLCDQERLYRHDDGTIVSRTVQTARHPDPMVEAYRWHACEGQLVQSLARPRAMTHGTAEAPIITFVLTDTPLSVPINAEVSGADIMHPPEWARQLTAGGVVFKVKNHAKRAYPGLHANNASRFRDDVRERPNWPLPPSFGHLRAFSGKNTYRELHPTVRIDMTKIDYRLEGAAQNAATAWVCLKLCPDPRAWIEGRLGSLAEFSTSERHDGPIDRVLGRGIVLDPSTKKGQWRWWSTMTGKSEEACGKSFDRDVGLRLRWQAAWEASTSPVWQVRLKDARFMSVVRIPAETEEDACALLSIEGAKLRRATAAGAEGAPAVPTPAGAGTVASADIILFRGNTRAVGDSSTAKITRAAARPK